MCYRVGQVHRAHLAHHDALRFRLVGEHVQLAMQQRLNGGNGRFGLDNMTGFRKFVSDAVKGKPGRDCCNISVRRLYDARDLVDVKVLPVARRSAEGGFTKSGVKQNC